MFDALKAIVNRVATAARRAARAVRRNPAPFAAVAALLVLFLVVR